MAQQRTRGRGGMEESFDTSLMYDDIERIRDREQEAERTENDKLSFAGMMSLVAGLGLIAVGIFGSALGGNIIEFLTPALGVVGFGALGYGFYKTLKLAFRKKELDFPDLNVYRKSKPRQRPASASASAGARTSRTSTSSDRAGYQDRERTYRRRRRRTRTSSSTSTQQKKALSRSRVNRVFSGVAGGIAEYTGVSSSLIRFALIAGTFMTGGFPFIFIYLLLSIILPTDYDSTYFDNDIDDGREIRIR